MGLPKPNNRRSRPEWYDSLYEPAAGIDDPSPPMASAVVPTVPPRSSTESDASDVVCVAVRSAPVASAVHASLRAADIAVSGTEALSVAALVIVDAAADVAKQVAELRALTRPDAAVLVVLARTGSAEDVTRAAAAGALACLRAPFVPAELVRLVQATLESRADKQRIETLSKKLDLETHLASIGRMSAGLTHELANPLSVAFSNLEYIRAETDRLLGAVRKLASASPEQVEGRLAAVQKTLQAVDSAEGLTSALDETHHAYARLHTLLQTMQGLVGKSGSTSAEPVDLLGIANEVVTKWLSAETQGIELEVLGTPVYAAGDRVLVGQIVQNLTANAIHAARSLPTPRIRLHAYLSEGRAVISVRDNGPGIPHEMQQQVFEPFFTTRRGKGGTGLGLALCREYAIRMNAELALWSVPGRGTCFRLTMQPHKWR